VPAADAAKLANRSTSFKMVLRDIASGDESSRTIKFEAPEK